MFGPLDFRLPQSHAIYWAAKGLKENDIEISFEGLGRFWAVETKEEERELASEMPFNVLRSARTIRASLQDIFRRGKFDITDQDVPVFSPDLRFVDTLHRLHLALGKQDMGDKWDGTAGERFRSAHVNFLRKAIALLYQYGREDLARQYWNILKKLYPNREYDVPMSRFVFDYILEDLDAMGITDVAASVDLFLTQAYQRYALGDDYGALAIERVAKLLYDQYMKDRAFKSETGRVDLRPLPVMKREALERVLKVLPPRQADRLRTRLGLPLEATPEKQQFNE